MEPRRRATRGLILTVALAGCAPHAAQPLPRQTLAHYLAGRVSLERDDPAEAVVELHAAVALTPDEPELVVALVRALTALATSQATAASSAAPPELLLALRRWPRHAALWHAAAELWQAFGAKLAAKRALRRALAEDPAYEPAALALIEHLREEGDEPGALAVARGVLAHVPTSAAARLALARGLVATEAHRAAIAELRAALRDDPDDLEVRALLASELAFVDALPEAVAQARSAFSRSGEHLSLAEPLFWLLCEAGDRAAAIDLLGIYDDDRRSIDELVAAIGWSLQLGELAIAERLATRALVAASGALVAERGDGAAAPEAIDAALANALPEPDTTAAVLAAAEVALFAGAPARVQSLLATPAARASPRARAILLAQLAEREDPAQVLRIVAALPEDERRPRLGLLAARATLATARDPDAARAWLPAPTGATYETLLARAQLELELSDPAAALAFAERALALRPRSPRALEAVARALVQAKHDLPRAGRLLDEARRLAPGRPGLLAARSAWLRETGAVDLAVALAVRATTLAPHDADIAYHLGRALAARRQPAAAALAYARALTLHPPPHLAARLRNALRP